MIFCCFSPNITLYKVGDVVKCNLPTPVILYVISWVDTKYLGISHVKICICNEIHLQDLKNI